MNNSFFNRFVPKQPHFFVLLKDLSDTLVEASNLLSNGIKAYKPETRETFYKEIKEVERKGDKITHQILDELETTFITPLDREDINLLTSAMEDVIDRINSAVKRINIYNPKTLGSNAAEMCYIIQKESETIRKSMDELEIFRKNPAKLRGYCQELHDLENTADDVYEHFIMNLFEQEKDGIELIKVKEIMHELEKATDAAEHVGKILKSLVVKYV